MKSSLIGFLLRYWLLVVSVPSIVIPTYLFFLDFRDIHNFSVAQVAYEAQKYLLPGIFIFLGLSVLIAIVFLLINALVLPSMVERLSYRTFKVFFLLLSTFLTLTPPLIWYLVGNDVNSKFASLVIPAYALSAVLWGALLVRPKKFASWHALIHN